MITKGFSKREALKVGWDTVKQHKVFYFQGIEKKKRYHNPRNKLNNIDKL